VLAGVAVDVEKGVVAGQPSGADAEHESSLGQVVQIGHPVRQLGRMVVREQVDPGG